MNVLQNKRGAGIIGSIMLFGVFIVIWFIWLGGWVAYVGHNAVVENDLTGFVAFFLDNLNLVIMIVIILAMMGWMYFGGSQQ